jgi:dCMP deaminase
MDRMLGFEPSGVGSIPAGPAKIKMKQKFINLYMDWAERCAELSHARRLHVGAVIVKDDTVISYGYNGMPAGWDNDCEDKVYDPGAGGWLSPEEIEEQYPYEGWHEGAGRNVRYGLKTKPEVLHAESNAIAKLAKSTNSGRGADLFVTHSPCLDCAKLIYQSGIRRVWYGTNYRDDSGIKFLEKSGVEVSKIEKNN